MSKKLFLSLISVTVLFISSTFASESSSQSCAIKHGESIAQYMFVPRIVDAVSKTGLSAAQTKKVADGIVSYNRTMQKIKEMQIFPVDSFINDSFNEKKFIKEMSEKYIAKIAAKAALFKYVFAVLNKEQKKAFKNAYAAPMIESMIKANY